MRCPRCDAEQEGQPNYCTSCGYALSEDAPAAERPAAPGGATAATQVEARFVACPTCGATNAASRRGCGRCGADLGGDRPSSAAPAPPASIPALGAEAIRAGDQLDAPVESGSPMVFAIAVTLAGIAILGVILTMLTASGVGPFASQEPEPQDTMVAISSVRASSVRGAAAGRSSEPEHLIDGDPTTAWRESASGDGVGEWVELQLEGNPQVARLVLWNGDQGEQRYTEGSRPSQLRIDVGERTFTADLLDIEGPQAIELPQNVEANAIRLTITAVNEGAGGVAISEIEARGPRPLVD